MRFKIIEHLKKKNINIKARINLMNSKIASGELYFIQILNTTCTTVEQQFTYFFFTNKLYYSIIILHIHVQPLYIISLFQSVNFK